MKILITPIFYLTNIDDTYSILFMNLITKAIKIVGIKKLGEACGIAYQCIYDWEKRSRLPRTDWTGETNYSSVIEKLTKGHVTRAELLKLESNNKGKILSED